MDDAVDGAVSVVRDGAVAVVTIERAHKRNALNTAVLSRLVSAVAHLDADPAVRAIVVAGQATAFAAGADVGELGQAGPVELYLSGFSEHWDALAATRTPLVAAVAGYALGGGLELALLCDVVIASEDAQLGFPETRIGVVPGAGGTQRLVRSVGKALAMDLLLTGRRLTAAEALAAGLVSRVVAPADLAGAAHGVAASIAKAAPLATALAKHAVLTAYEVPLSAGIAHERVLSALIAGSRDRAEGMSALRERRTPTFEGR